jgi:hypothetical protein
LIAVFRLLRSLIAPWELRRLMRRMPTTPRLWVPAKSGIRPETNAEYLARLRERAREKASRSSTRDPARRAVLRQSLIVLVVSTDHRPVSAHQPLVSEPCLCEVEVSAS